MERLLDAWMGPVWMGDSSWLALASLRALIVCFTLSVLTKGARRPSARAAYVLYMAGTLVVFVAFSMSFTYSIIHETHQVLTYDRLFVNVGFILCMLGALRNDNRIREAEGREPTTNLGGLTGLQRRASLVLGILVCVFTVSIPNIQLVFGVLGVALMTVYLLPGKDE